MSNGLIILVLNLCLKYLPLNIFKKIQNNYSLFWNYLVQSFVTHVKNFKRTIYGIHSHSFQIEIIIVSTKKNWPLKHVTCSPWNNWPPAIQTTNLQPSKSAQLFKVSAALSESLSEKRKVEAKEYYKMKFSIHFLDNFIFLLKWTNNKQDLFCVRDS